MVKNIDLFTHNSVRIKGQTHTVYIDPFQMKEEPKDADFILVTHDHFDHFSPEDIAKVSKGDTVLVFPENMKGKAQEAAGMVGRMAAVEPGRHYEIDGLEFDTVPAYNSLKPFHPKSAGWVGYNLNIDGSHIYNVGDSDATKEARQVKCDIILVPIGGTYTMDAKKAAKLVNEISPAVAIPTHYGSVAGKEEDARIFAANVKEPVKVEIIKQY